MANKKVLIITYYWPPSGGSGVQRWLKFVKYLHQNGWEPIVLTPENPSFTMHDNSLLKDVPASVEVLKLPIWEPYELFGKLLQILGKKKLDQTDFVTTGKKSVLQKISTWIRGNLFIPDPRIFWIRPATRLLTDIIRSNNIEKIITTGPPHSIHLIGVKLKKQLPTIKWIADFRDPWTDWDLLDTLSLTKWARYKHHKLEREVLQRADRVITIGPYHVNRLQTLGGRPVDLLTNGFDEDDFASIERRKTTKFTLRHIGIVDELRDPRPVMMALKNVCAYDVTARDLMQIEFIGNVNTAFKEWVAADPLLASITKFVGYQPHQQIVRLYGETDLLLLALAHTVIAPGNLPGKFFEYLASGTPILAIGPVNGDTGHILKETGAGAIFERDQISEVEQFIQREMSQWKQGKTFSSQGIYKFSRRNLTNQLIGILESL